MAEIVESKMHVEIVKGDLLLSNLPIIAHQCNCVTTKGAGLSANMFKMFPYSDIYTPKKGVYGSRVPGELKLSFPPLQYKESKTFQESSLKSFPIIAGLLGQYNPGKPTLDETRTTRLKWFQQSLQMLGKYMNKHKLKVVGMPYLIGCGLAGGNWDDYSKAIHIFSKTYNISVKLYKIFS